VLVLVDRWPFTGGNIRYALKWDVTVREQSTLFRLHSLAAWYTHLCTLTLPTFRNEIQQRSVHWNSWNICLAAGPSVRTEITDSDFLYVPQPCQLFQSIYHKNSKCTYKETLRRVHITTVAIEKLQVLNIMNVCLYHCLIYAAGKAHAPCYIVVCGLSGSTTFFHIISQAAWFSETKFEN
jgi:hypothetical protein